MSDARSSRKKSAKRNRLWSTLRSSIRFATPAPRCQPRTIRIGKGGNWFCYPEYIGSEMVRVFRELGNPDHLADLDSVGFARHVAHIVAEINAVHPFREGNGRTQLTFLAMLAEYAGFTFNADILERDRVIQAMIDSFSGSEAPLQALIEDIITSP